MVLIVVVVVLAGYYALVQTGVIPDFNQPDPISDWDAFAKFEVDISYWLVTSLSANAVVTEITPTVEPFEDMGTGRIYEDSKLFRGHGGGGGTYRGDIWINVTVTGAGAFKAYWDGQPYHIPILESNTASDPGRAEIQTGRVFFENAGEYTILVKIYAQLLDGYPYVICSKYQAFEVET